MKTTALIERGKDGIFGIYTPDIETTIIGSGSTVAEAKSDFENSVKEVLAYYEETGKPIPEELKEITFEYKYDTASVFDELNCINLTKFAKFAGIYPSTMRQYIIALYIRLSLEDYKTESLSIHNQRAALRKHAQTLAEADNAEILEFVDNGYSGTNFERPAVQELLELVRCNKVDCIIVKDFSRFGRNSIETGYFLERVFPLFQTRFISVNDDYDTINYKGDTGGLEVAFKYLINETYSRDLSIKSKSAKYAKMRRGEYISKVCPYGYEKGAENRLKIDEEAAAVVRMIFDLSLQGNDAPAIVAALYAKGIPTPGEYKAAKGFKMHDVSRCHHVWPGSTVLRILADERYMGTYIMGKRAVTEIGGSRTRLKDENEWFKIPGHHPAIIDRAVFEQVQAQLLHFKSVKKTAKTYPLRGMVICGCCGHAMHRHRKDPVYSCRHSRFTERFGCFGLTVGERELESMLFTIISKQAEVILGLDAITGIRELQARLSEQGGYERMIRDCKDGKMRLYEEYLLGKIGESKYMTLKAVYDAELNDLNSFHSALAARTSQMIVDNAAKTKIRTIATEISNEKALTRELAETLIDRVEIFPGDRIEIAWKISDFAGEGFRTDGGNENAS